MIGHRKRMYAALSGWSHEMFSTNTSVVGVSYSNRRQRSGRILAHKLLRNWQKRVDRSEIVEQTQQ